MHKVQLISKDDSDIEYEIYVHPYLVTDWGGDDDNEKLIWTNGKSVSESIDGKETDLVQISDDDLNNIGGGDDYRVNSIILRFSYFMDEDDIYEGRNPINVEVSSYQRVTGQHRWNSYKLLDYVVPFWYMKLSQKYQQQEQENQRLREENLQYQERIKQLEHELSHEKYQPGGSGYQKAKEDFENCKKSYN